MTKNYFPIIYIVPLINIDGQASPRLFIAPEIRHKKISYTLIIIDINDIMFKNALHKQVLTLMSLLLIKISPSNFQVMLIKTSSFLFRYLSFDFWLHGFNELKLQLNGTPAPCYSKIC